MKKWIDLGQPFCFWLPGFFFPQGFITGTLQTYARKTNTPIDTLDFQFQVLQQMNSSEIKRSPKVGYNTIVFKYLTQDGVYVYGLFIEGAKLSAKDKILEDS